MNVRDFTRARVRMIVLCVFALCALTVVPASAVAAGHHDASAHKAKAKGKPKKKPKKKSTTVIVKCASVTVTCKGTPGATGPQGPAGANGANGSAVVLRARGAGPIAAVMESAPPGCDSFSCVVGANVPVTPSTWTEGPTEDDQMIGTITVKLPSKTECAAAEDSSTKEPDDPEVYVVVTVNGIVEGLTGAASDNPVSTSTAITSTVSLFSESILELEFEEEGGASEVGTGFFLGNGSSSQTHTMSVEAIDNCKGTPVTVSNAAIDVLASY